MNEKNEELVESITNIFKDLNDFLKLYQRQNKGEKPADVLSKEITTGEAIKRLEKICKEKWFV